VTVRHVALPIGAVLVLGVGLYLFVEVRAQPAALQLAPARAPAPSIDPPRSPSPASSPPSSSSPASSPPSSSDRPVAPAAGSAPAAAQGDLERELPKPRLDALMDEANKAYDRGELEEAKQLAMRLLATFPTNVRMLRIVVSASCIDGDTAVAQAHFARLPGNDQEQMRVRCGRYGVTFGDKS
jgi:hypothetical protein